MADEIVTRPGPGFGDDVVDAADFMVWREARQDGDNPPDPPNTLGLRVSAEASDYGVWQSSFGRSDASLDLLGTAPASDWLFL